MSLTLTLPKRDFIAKFLKPMKTRAGSAVELLTANVYPLLSDGRGIIGIVTDSHGKRYVETWFSNGAYFFGGESVNDLVNT